MPRSLLSFAVLLAAGSVALAGGANFYIRAEGLAPAKAGEDIAKAGVFREKIAGKGTVGKPFTLVAQGMVLPRGGKPSPAAGTGAWTYDEKAFTKAGALPKGGKGAIAVTLTPKKAGTYRITFAGEVLGYKTTLEAVVEVAGAK